MKNFLLVLLCSVCVIGVSAQGHVQKPLNCVNETDRNVKTFAAQVSAIANSDMNPAHKEARLVGLMGVYLSKYQSNAKYGSSGFVKGTKSYSEMVKGDQENTSYADVGKNFYKDCDPKRVRAFLDDFVANRFLHIPAKYLAKLGDVKTDCALAKAVEIYNSVGYEYISSANICELIGCNSSSSRKAAPMSRGAITWAYTGVKRFVTDEDNFGWRYLCVKSESNDDKDANDGYSFSNRIEEAIRYIEDNPRTPVSQEDFVRMAGLSMDDVQWRKEDEVTKW